ncbi:MAG: ATP-binding protein, partial [Candidatus Glassbacteria bacterium]
MLTSLTVERLKELKLDGMARALAKQLASSSQWIRDHLNVLIIDPTGVGKRFMACALGHKGCLECFRVSCTRAPRLF